MKSFRCFFLCVAAIFAATGLRAQSLSPTGVTATPGSVLPGATVSYAVAVSNGAATQFGPGATANFTIVLTNLTTGTSFNVGPVSAAPTSGIIAAAAVDPTTGAVTPGAGTFTVTGVVPLQATQAGDYRATVTINSVTAGSIGTASFSVGSGVLTITGKPDLQITSLIYAASTSYVGGNLISPMSLTFRNNISTNGSGNVPYVPGVGGHPSFVRIQVVLSSNPTFGDADDFQLTISDVSAGTLATMTGNGGNTFINADGLDRTISWNQLLPGNFAGSYYVLAKVDSLNALSQNDPAALTVNGNNVWGGNTLNPSGTLINLLPSNFPATFLASHATGVTTSASSYSDNPSISADGRYVVFASDATNLVTGDTNAARDVFIFDSQTTLIRRLSVSQQGVQGNGASNNPVISGDGRYVAFASDANNLVFGDTNGFTDIFVVDTITGLISRVSTTTAGAQSNNPSFRPSIAQNGRYIVFESTATNLDSAYTVTPGSSHIYLRDRDVAGTGTYDTVGNNSTRLVDVDFTTPASVTANANSIQAQISADGSTIAFASKGTNLATVATTASRQHVYTRPRASVGASPSAIKLISVADTTAAEGNANSQTPSLSSDGRWIAFASLATNLVGADTNGVSDIFVYDGNSAIATPAVVRVSVSTAGAQAVDPSSVGFQLGSINPTISSDGRYVAFASLANNLASGDSNGQFQATDANNALDIFVRDRQVSGSGAFDVGGNVATTLVSVNSFGYQTNGLLGTPSTAASNIYPVLSANGRYVAFPSDSENNAGLAFGATNLLPLDSNGFRDVFLYDRRTNASISPNSPPTVTITSPGNNGSALVNTAVSINASATAATVGGTPIGVVSSVQFFVNGTSLGSTAVFPYTQTWTPTAVGTYTLSALVTDSFGNQGISPNVTVTINAAPSIGVTSPVAGASIVVNTPTTVTGVAAASNPGATIASVQFFANGTSIGTAATAPYSVSWTPTLPGVVSLTAVATDSIGTQTTSPVVSVTITPVGGGGGGGGSGGPVVVGNPPTVSVTSPAASTQLPVNTPAVIAATASDSDGNIASVQFFANNVSVGSTTTYPYNVVWTPTSLGAYSITAKATDSDGNLVTSTVVSVSVVDPAPNAPTVAVTLPTSGAIISVGIAQTLQANASDNVAVTGVQFFVNGQPLGAQVTTFPFITPWTPSTPGNYTIAARATNVAGNQATSASIAVVVSGGTPPTASISSPATGASVSVNTPQIITATAVSAAGTIAKVDFFVNGVSIGSDSSFPYSTSWTPSAVGTYVLRVRATDNLGNITDSTSSSVGVIAGATPTVALTNPVTGSSYAVSTPLSITATAADADGTVAQVQFFVNNLAQGTADTSAPYVASWTPNAAGSYILSAQATDNAGNVTTSSTVTVTIFGNGAPTVGIVSPLAGASSSTGSPVALTAVAADTDGSVASVRFLVNGNVAGSPVTTAPFTTTWTPSAAGTYSIVAEATDNSGNVTNSAVRTFTVVANQAPTVSVTLGSTSGTTGTPVNLGASAADVDGTIVSVRFLVNGNVIGAPATAAPFTATWTPSAAGTYSIVAEATDNSGNVTNSAARTFNVVVNQAPTVSLTSPSNGTGVNAGAILTLSATAADADGTVTSVRFLANGTLIAALSAPPYLGTWTPTASGVYSLTAQATDNVGNVTNSSVVQVSVTANQSPTVRITSPTNGGTVRVGASLNLIAAASDNDGTIASVQFFANGVPLGSALTAPASNGGYRTPWTPNSEGLYRLSAIALDNSGAVTTSTTVVVIGSTSAGDAISMGTYSGLAGTNGFENGNFAVIASAGKTATFIAYSTTNGVNKTYFQSAVPVDVGGGFSATDASGNSLVAGTASDTGVSGTLDKARLTFIGIDTRVFATGNGLPSGYFGGTLTGRPTSTFAAIIGADGSILLYAADGSFNDAGGGGTSKLDATGSFNIPTLRGNRFIGKADPTTGLLTGTLSGSNGGAFSLGPKTLSAPTSVKVAGAATEVGHDIVYPLPPNNVYDQVLLQGASATITADPGQITRMSFLDLTNDIVQVEFSGAGTLSLTLDNPSGPIAPINYNQPGITYMRGHAGIVISGADETTNVSVFSVGKITAIDQGLFKSEVSYDGMADLAYIVILTADGKFGGIRTANTNFFATKGLTGICAPGVQFTGPIYVGDISASDSASPMLLVGSVTDARVTGGSLLQMNGQPVQVSGLSQLKFVDGMTSQGKVQSAQANRARLQQNGADVAAQVAVDPKP